METKPAPSRLVAPISISTTCVSLTPRTTDSKRVYNREKGRHLFRSCCLGVGISVEALAEANNIGDGDIIQVGQELVVPDTRSLTLHGDALVVLPALAVLIALLYSPVGRGVLKYGDGRLIFSLAGRKLGIERQSKGHVGYDLVQIRR